MKYSLLGIVVACGFLMPSFVFAADYCFTITEINPIVASCIQYTEANKNTCAQFFIPSYDPVVGCAKVKSPQQCIAEYEKLVLDECNQYAQEFASTEQTAKDSQEAYKKFSQEWDAKKDQYYADFVNQVILQSAYKAVTEAYTMCTSKELPKCLISSGCKWLGESVSPLYSGDSKCVPDTDMTCEKLPQELCGNAIFTCIWGDITKQCISKKDVNDLYKANQDVIGAVIADNELRAKASKLNKIASVTIQDLLGRIIKTAMGIMGSLALVMIVYGGFLWMTAAGNAEKDKKGLEIIIWAALGIGVIFSSYALINFVFEIFT